MINLRRNVFILLQQKFEQRNSDIFKTFFFVFFFSKLLQVKYKRIFLNAIFFWSTSIPSVLFFFHKFEWTSVIYIVQQKGFDCNLQCIFKRLYSMKPEVRNLYLYHTRNTFISMIFFPFLSKQTELFSLWSRTIPSFQICGTWQMSFIVSKPLGIIFCLLQLWWSQWQPDSYTATESNQHESFMRLLIHGIIRLESQKKDDRVSRPVQQTNSSVSCHKILLPLPQHFLP